MVALTVRIFPNAYGLMFEVNLYHDKGGTQMTSLIISGLVIITLLCTGLFIILCQVCSDEIDRRDAINVEKNKREMGL